MKSLVLESWLLLLRFERIMRSHEFRELHRTVLEAPARPTTEAEPVPSEHLSNAMDYACVFYFKRVLCLQRSAATTLLLRRHGWNAEMVIGTQMLPFNSHAWVELDGKIVNDKPYMLEIYQELERC